MMAGGRGAGAYLPPIWLKVNGKRREGRRSPQGTLVSRYGAQSDFTVESLTERLCEEYDVTAEEARSCVTDLLENLEKEGVIEAQ